tara:strand:+ start:332 stop:1960 length:1629 start_codon:yes stop_codon:yes gene_type:complete
MALQSLELGSAADDGTGDSLRVGGDKINDNFVELYTALGDGDALSSGISASGTVITLVAPIITEIDSGSTITLDATTDIILDADGGDIFFKDAGTTFGSATNTSGNLIIKSGTTTAATFSGANVTLAGTLGVGAITTTGAFKGADGYTIGNASVAAVMTLASTGIVTFVDDIVLKDAATIGVASSTSAITIASTGIVTLVDDLVLKDAATIGVASSTSAITIASTGIVTFVDDILIKDVGTIGSASDPDAIAIGADGDVTLTQDLELQHDGAILSFGANDEVSLTHVHDTGILLNSTNVIQFNDASQNIGAPSNAILDINATDEIELNATLVDINANVEISGTATTTGVHTFTAVPLFPNNTVETADIQADAITSAKIADDAIDSEHYTDASIDAAHFSLAGLQAPFQLDATPPTDHTATGPQTNTLNAGYAAAAFDLVILGSSSTWLEADADATGTSINMMGLTLAAASSGAAVNVALPGAFVRDDTFNFTPGAALYVSGTLGAMTHTKPTGSGDIVRTVGYALTADVVFFQPSSDFVVLA